MDLSKESQTNVYHEQLSSQQGVARDVSWFHFCTREKFAPFLVSFRFLTEEPDSSFWTVLGIWAHKSAHFHHRVVMVQTVRDLIYMGGLS